MNGAKRRIGLGFITGRKSFRDVLTTYLNSWGEHVLSSDEPVELSLFVAYDLDYNKTQRSDYTNISINLRDMLKEIHFIDRNTVKSEAQTLKENRILSDKESSLFFDKGYAGKRNAILYTALKSGMDSVLFLDDDEYPLAVQKQNGAESWTGQQILATHLKYIDQADITNGHHCGYISPIPNLTFNAILSESDFRIFIEAISNDIINWKNIKRLMTNGNITYAEAEVLSGGASEVELVENTKFISGSNLCINLKDPRRVSPFYNPPSARGEDTFLSTCLSERTVLRIPCYAFHDGFSSYTSLLKGVLPKRLKHITADTKRVTARFLKTCVGWVRYKPLLLYITNRTAYRSSIDKMRRDLTLTLPKLSEYFSNPKFMEILSELDKYDAAVEKHYAEFIRTQEVWAKLVDHLV